MEEVAVANMLCSMYIIQLAFSNLTTINIINNIIQKTMEGFVFSCVNLIVISLNTLYNKYRFDLIDQRFENIESDVSVLKSDVSVLKSDVSKQNKRMTNIESMLKLLLEHNGLEFNEVSEKEETID